ncbi:MAG: nickel-dependent lactate racemase [Planctomycetes bacterium]|nr:nickel-dependent lactate racemase [Planctomycetota bacterium]
MEFAIPFGRTTLPLTVPDARVRAVLESRFGDLKSDAAEIDIVRSAMRSPIGSPPLAELARGRKTVAVITSDHTRPVPSHLTIPLMLEEIRQTAPDAAVTIVVATGCHRPMTEEEMRQRFGPAVYERERILVHDAQDNSRLRSIGLLPSGGDCSINTTVLDADLVVADGFIEPHFFAGFSGGRKAILPGSASRTTVLANHCAEFIDDERSRTGILDGNPIHTDMIFAARAARLAYIVNVVLDAEKRVVAAFAGDADLAHRQGCELVARHTRVKAAPADIVVTSNGGYPLDQNVYQAVKSMTAAEASCRRGGVIIVASECRDGHGGEEMSRCFSRIPTAAGVMEAIRRRGREETLPDQWQIQIFCRVLLHATVIMVTGPGAPREMIEGMNMLWAPSLPEALGRAETILANPEASVTVIPDGVGVIVEA